MAKRNPTQTTRPTAPAPGTRPSIRVDDALSDDLAVIMSAGVNMSDAVREAVTVWADMHRAAWAHGMSPQGSPPRLLAYELEQLTFAPPATRDVDDLSDRAPRLRRVAPRLPAPPPGPHIPAQTQAAAEHRLRAVINP
ncbi:hypothetical protein [Streptomyces sp. NPDC002104]